MSQGNGTKPGPRALISSAGRPARPPGGVEKAADWHDIEEATSSPPATVPPPPLETGFSVLRDQQDSKPDHYRQWPTEGPWPMVRHALAHTGREEGPVIRPMLAKEPDQGAFPVYDIEKNHRWAVARFDRNQVSSFFGDFQSLDLGNDSAQNSVPVHPAAVVPYSVFVGPP